MTPHVSRELSTNSTQDKQTRGQYLFAGSLCFMASMDQSSHTMVVCYSSALLMVNDICILKERGREAKGPAGHYDQ